MVKERIEAGVLSYSEAVEEAIPQSSPLQKRIKVVLKSYESSFWRDHNHAKRFEQAQNILGYCKERNTNAYYATLFLLTSDDELLRSVMNCFCEERIDFSLIKSRNMTPENYALYKIAKSLYTDSAEVGVDELADPELVSTESFHLVVNAMLISRYGLSALSLTSEDGVYGAF